MIQTILFFLEYFLLKENGVRQINIKCCPLIVKMVNLENAFLVLVKKAKKESGKKQVYKNCIQIKNFFFFSE